MKLREHRASLRESMASVVTIAPTREAILTHINLVLAPYERTFTDQEFTIEYYGRDERIGWDQYYILILGFGVFGFIDGPVEEKVICPSCLKEKTDRADHLFIEQQGECLSCDHMRLETHFAPLLDLDPFEEDG